jgi:hypothetical protein
MKQARGETAALVMNQLNVQLIGESETNGSVIAIN